MVALLICCLSCLDTATPEISTLSLHDALPISPAEALTASGQPSSPPRRTISSGDATAAVVPGTIGTPAVCIRSDRKSTRLNSSHLVISYAVFCLKKKTKKQKTYTKKMTKETKK